MNLIASIEILIALLLGGMLAASLGFSSERPRSTSPGTLAGGIERVRRSRRSGRLAPGIVTLEPLLLGLDYLWLTVGAALIIAIAVELGQEDPWIYVAPLRRWVIGVGLACLGLFGAMVTGTARTVDAGGAVLAAPWVFVACLLVFYVSEDLRLGPDGIIRRRRWLFIRLPGVHRAVEEFGSIRIRRWLHRGERIHRVVLTPRNNNPFRELEVGRVRNSEVRAWEVAREWAATSGLPITGTPSAGIADARPSATKQPPPNGESVAVAPDDTSVILSAAGARYLLQGAIDDRTFVAALLEMATKRVIVIDRHPGSKNIAIARGPAPAWSAGVAEREIADSLFSRGAPLAVTGYSAPLRLARARHAATLRRTLDSLFTSRLTVFFLGACISALLAAPTYAKIVDALPADARQVFAIAAAFSAVFAWFAAAVWYDAALAVRRGDVWEAGSKAMPGAAVCIMGQLCLGAGSLLQHFDLSDGRWVVAGIAVPLAALNMVAARLLRRVPNEDGQRLRSSLRAQRRQLQLEAAAGRLPEGVRPLAYALGATRDAYPALEEAIVIGLRGEPSRSFGRFRHRSHSRV